MQYSADTKKDKKQRNKTRHKNLYSVYTEDIKKFNREGKIYVIEGRGVRYSLVIEHLVTWLNNKHCSGQGEGIKNILLWSTCNASEAILFENKHE